ncbi:hypothetical protein COOONC_21465 [Cooperia oncophora]
MVLALNRVVEMIPSAYRLRFLFQGKTLYFWMVLSVMYMLALPFLNRTHPFNTADSAYTPLPMITDNFEQEAAYYGTILIPIHNIFFVIVVLSLYTILCVYVVRMRGIPKEGNYKMQLQVIVSKRIKHTFEL